MDDSFPVEFWQTDLFWLDAAPTPVPAPAPAPAPVTQISAFVPYSAQPTTRSGQENNSRNINKSMIEYWRKNWNAQKEEQAGGGDPGREKCYRHMLNERMRREKQKQSYLALHSMLPRKTKNDKNSIVQMAARTIEELKSLGEILGRRNLELEMALAEKKREKENETTPTPTPTPIIKVSLNNPSSGINSMLSVLNLLKTVGVNPKAIHATFFDAQFSAQLAIDTHMRAAELETALQVTLSEAEKKFQGLPPGSIQTPKRKPF